MILWTMYVDDGQISDFEEAGRCGQEVVHEAFTAFGAEFPLGKCGWIQK